MDELKLLLEDGNIGFYRSCEAVQFFLCNVKDDTVFNLYTIYVFEDYECIDAEAEYIGKRIKVDKNYFVGAIKKRISIDDAVSVYQALLHNQCSKSTVSIDFKIKGTCSIGVIKKRLKQFVPPNQNSSDIPLNRVLKKNFYNGSYVLEFFDVEKKWLSTSNNEKIKDAVIKASDRIPIHLDLLLDRLGNVIFQFPSELINVSAHTIQQNVENEIKLIPQEILLQIKRDSRIKDSVFHITVLNELDGAITGAFIGETTEEMNYPIGLNSWDPTVIILYNDKGLLLHKAYLTIIKGIATASTVSTRLFRTLPDKKIIELREYRYYEPRVVHSYDKLIMDRINIERLDKLKKEKYFIQYGADGKKESEKAIKAIRELINQQNCKSVYLWDPFLSALDIINILFYCEYTSVEMKAISAGIIPPISNDKCDITESTDSTIETSIGSSKTTNHEMWLNEQRQKLDVKETMYTGLSLEFRCLFGNNGYKFHDRFLIIQYYNQPPRVWSIGTSFNSIGNTHHILQKVEHGNYIVAAFDKLWLELDNEQCFVWGCKNGKKIGKI